MAKTRFGPPAAEGPDRTSDRASVGTPNSIRISYDVRRMADDKNKKKNAARTTKTHIERIQKMFRYVIFYFILRFLHVLIFFVRCDFYQIPALEEDQSCTESWQRCDTWNIYCQDDCFSTLCNASKRTVCENKVCDSYCTFHSGAERRDDCANLPEVQFCEKYDITSSCASTKNNLCTQGQCDR